MKKVMIVIVLIVAALFIFAYLTRSNTQPEQEEPNYTEVQTIVSNSYSDIKNISIQASGIYKYPDKTTLVINWENNTEHSITYTDAYQIERLENGQWVCCAPQDPTSSLTIANAHELSANELDAYGYILSETCDISKPGTYRFLTTCTINAGEEKTVCSLWAEFIIE